MYASPPFILRLQSSRFVELFLLCSLRAWLYLQLLFVYILCECEIEQTLSPWICFPCAVPYTCVVIFISLHLYLVIRVVASLALSSQWAPFLSLVSTWVERLVGDFIVVFKVELSPVSEWSFCFRLKGSRVVIGHWKGRSGMTGLLRDETHNAVGDVGAGLNASIDFGRRLVEVHGY